MFSPTKCVDVEKKQFTRSLLYKIRHRLLLKFNKSCQCVQWTLFELNNISTNFVEKTGISVYTQINWCYCNKIHVAPSLWCCHSNNHIRKKNSVVHLAGFMVCFIYIFNIFHSALFCHCTIFWVPPFFRFFLAFARLNLHETSIRKNWGRHWK